MWIRRFLLDLRYSLRGLRHSPGYTTTVALTLALGIGGSTAIFGFVQGVLLRPLPFPEPENLVLVCETHPDRSSDRCGGSPANVQDWRRASNSLESIGLARSWHFSLKNRDGKLRGVSGGIATAGMFDAFRVEPLLGRVFVEGDHHEGRDKVVILSHRLWQNRLGADEEILGKSVNLDEETYYVIGVLPPGFEVPYLEQVELWIPLWSDRTNWRHWRGLRPYGRLAAGVSLGEARAELETIAARLADEYPKTNTGSSVRVDRLQDRMVASVRPALLIFLGAVGFVLLIACANAANLMLARGTNRAKELAIRAALGAGRAGLLRSVLAESLVLASLGGAAGILLAGWLMDLFVALVPPGFPRIEEVGMNGVVLLSGILLALSTSLVFGLVPAWQSSRVSPMGAMKETCSLSSSKRSNRIRGMLVAAEVGLALILLVGSGLLMRSFLNMTDWEPGFDTEHLITFSTFPPLGKYQDAAALGMLYRRINDDLSALPGVVSVGEVSAGPLFGGGDGVTEFYIESRPVPAEGEFPTTAWFDCGPSYFRTMGIGLRRGRYFGASDDSSAPPVAIINETMARRYWPGEDPLGQRVQVRSHQTSMEIVGVVSDVQPFDPREPVQPEIYWPLEQAMRGATYYAVRTAVDPSTLVPSIQTRLEQVEPEMEISALTTLRERIDRNLIRPRFHMLLIGIFSTIALIIATIGVYGVISYAVVQRTREFGIRTALGAPRRHVIGLVLGKGLLLAGAGALIGTFGALALTHLIRGLLVEVPPDDPATFLGVLGLVLSIAMLACWIPAWRASQANPMEALRHE